MAKYEILKTIPLSTDNTYLQTMQLPELVHFDDSALAVLCDFLQVKPQTIDRNETMDDALNEMKVNGTHLLLVKGENNNICGIITSEDILGEKPIKIIHEKRVKRSQVCVKMIMSTIDQVPAFAIDTIRYAKVGNIVNTLKSLRKHFALVIDDEVSNEKCILRGIFTTSQISRQLHHSISDTIANESLTELHKRHSHD